MTVDRRFFETLMTNKKMSLRALASRMDMKHSQLSLTFSGNRRMQLDEATKLAEIFAVPLHRIAEAAGVADSRSNGKRVDVIGAMRGDGSVERHPEGVIERTIAPEGLPDNVAAVQAHTVDTPLSWMDGWVFFGAKTAEVEPDAIGRFCFAKIEDGPFVMATVRRGYRVGTFNLSGPYTKDSERLEWATPVLLTRM
jgi:transcriptional regulator with XRE-family HTH domain